MILYCVVCYLAILGAGVVTMVAVVLTLAFFSWMFRRPTKTKEIK